MGLLDNLEKPENKNFSCRIRTLVVEELGADDAKILETALADLGWKAETLSKALNQRGITVSGSVITRHRKGECSCSKI